MTPQAHFFSATGHGKRGREIRSKTSLPTQKSAQIMLVLLNESITHVIHLVQYEV